MKSTLDLGEKATIFPRGDRLLVERVEGIETKAANLGISTDEAPQSLRCKVLAIGPDVTDISVGDEIFCSQFAPTAIKLTPFDKTLMIPVDDVLAIVVSDKSPE
jgi:co-chaperonin GroES (HSP10)